MADYYDANPVRIPRIPIALIGFFGAETEAISTRVTALTGLNFVDVSQMMTHEAGAAPARIFLELGPEYFRSLARKCLERGLAGEPPGVLSLPHYMLDDADVRDEVARRAALVYLHQEFDPMVEKVRAMVEERPGVYFPWITPERICSSELQVMLNDRVEAYNQAVLQVDVTGRTPVHIAREIIEHFSLWEESNS